jgi:hypothetical protein
LSQLANVSAVAAIANKNNFFIVLICFAPEGSTLLADRSVSGYIIKSRSKLSDYLLRRFFRL